jgi:hypothetical protein
VRLRRLARMGPAELACRARQAAAKRLDALGLGGPRTLGGASLARRLAPAPARAVAGAEQGARMLLAGFRAAAPHRFFAGAASDAVVDVLDRRMPEARAAVLAEAERIGAGRFDLLGYRELDCGEPVDWHADPVSGRRAPRVHWSRIDPLDPGIGDSKVIWELNRHQWLVRLAQAYRLTGDERYAKALAETVRAWIEANPRGIGINWASSLELALRVIAWSWALVLVRDAEALVPDLFAAMLDGVAAQAAHVERHLSHYFAPNTHLTGEALGLLYAGVLFPELAGASRWRAAGTGILVGESGRQILADGVEFEQSTCYARYTAEIYLHAVALAARAGRPLPAAVATRLTRLLDALLALRRPDGALPRIGDDDGGRLLPLARRAPDDAGDVFSTAAVLFGRPDYAWAAGRLAPETLWLLGPGAADAFDGLRPAAPGGASRVLPDGGYVVMRSGWDARAHQLIFDVGPLGDLVAPGHAHADLLSVQCSGFGEPCVVDPGTFCYTADAVWRDHFRGTAAHGTVLVDGAGQAAAAGPFAWRSLPRARLARWHATAAWELADAEHTGYGRLPDPVTHRRRVAFVRSRYWIVADDLHGRRAHHVAVRFQFAPMRLSVEAGGWVRAVGPSGRGLLLNAFAAVPLAREVREGELRPPRGWVSPDYGARRPAPLLSLEATAALPLRVLTLLFPVDDAAAPPPRVRVVGGERGEPAGLALVDREEVVVFHDRELELRGEVA